MRKHKKIISSLSILLMFMFFMAGCGASATSSKDSPGSQGGKLMVHYIDVGQGDSMLIQVNNKNLLIDAGPASGTDKLMSYLSKNNIKKLDYVVATHPHEDHIGGMTSVIKKFQVGSFYAPKITTTTKTYQNMIDALKSKNLKINVAKAGVSLDLGENAKCEILAPVNTQTKYESLNNYSAVIKLTYGNNKFLFTGDAEKLVEKELLNAKSDLSSDVLKVGHHGSTSSSSKEFLDAVSPKIAVISVGKGNDYGHPHKETLTALKNRKLQIYRTDVDGTVILESDGNKITKKQ